MKRSTHIQLRVSPEEKAKIEARAAAAGFETSDYLRRMGLWEPKGGGSVEVREAEDGALEVRRGPTADWLRVDPAALAAAGWERLEPPASIEPAKPERHLAGA